MVQRDPCLVVYMDLLMMVMCHPFAQMFKLPVLMCSLKAFRLNLLSLWKTSNLGPLALYILLTVFNYLMMFSVLFEVQLSTVRKLILDEFVWRKGIPFIFKNILKSISVFLWCSNICFGSGTLGTLLSGLM